ncbi:1758_t:CDS:2, partial [Entrophospora sp. SA101]
MIRKNDLSEVEHTFRNIVPLLDAMIGKDCYFWAKYGEQSLEATAIRRNKERDPNDQLRDLWVIAGDHLTGVDISELVLWGLIVVGRKIRVYAFASSGFLFHLILMYEALLPSSREDLYNLELAYLLLKEYKKKLDEMKNMLIELSKKK